MAGWRTEINNSSTTKSDYSSFGETLDRVHFSCRTGDKTLKYHIVWLTASGCELSERPSRMTPCSSGTDNERRRCSGWLRNRRVAPVSVMLETDRPLAVCCLRPGGTQWWSTVALLPCTPRQSACSQAVRACVRLLHGVGCYAPLTPANLQRRRRYTPDSEFLEIRLTHAFLALWIGSATPTSAKRETEEKGTVLCRWEWSSPLSFDLWAYLSCLPFT